MKTKYSAEEWRDIITEWKEADTTRKKFCESKGLKITAFDYWRRKLGKNGSDHPKVVRISGPVSLKADVFIVRIGTSLTIEIPPSFESAPLIRLVQTLREIV